MSLIRAMLLVVILAVSATAQLKLGIDVLEAHNFDLLRQSPSNSSAAQGKTRIGLLTNQTGIDSHGQRTIDVLAHAPGIELTAIFSPEHGITGTLDTARIENTRDQATGVPVYSVYGATEARRRPPPDVMRKLDAVVFDLQDAGVRWFTYETTLGYFIEACSAAHIRLVVLDRPNPINGLDVQGPVSDAAAASFTNYHPIALRHGMTIGELALMFNEEKNLHADLKVVAMQGWRRDQWFDETQLEPTRGNFDPHFWVSPSPNLRSLTEATLYPGIAFIERTNVSVGRGTDTPFEVVGAPWVNGRELAKSLNARRIPGVYFDPETFTPASSQYAGQRCGGVHIRLTNRNSLNAPSLGVELASTLRSLYGEKFEIHKMQDLVTNEAVMKALLAGEDPKRIVESWRQPLLEFESRRERFLLY